MSLGLQPMDFLPLNLVLWQWILLRLLASCCGVFGFSIMFNSPVRLALAAGLIGAVSNTIRLELIDLLALPPAAAAFIGAFIAGLLASTLKGLAGYPRISLTVPSIVIMVPGLYLYKGFLQSWHYEPDGCCLLAGIRPPCHPSPASGADLCPHPHRQNLPLLHLAAAGTFLLPQGVSLWRIKNLQLGNTKGN